MKEAVEIDFAQMPVTGEVRVAAYVSPMKLSEMKIFVDFFIQELSVAMAKKVMDEQGLEISRSIQSTVMARLSDEVATKLLPQVLEKIDVPKLVNTVLLQAARKQLKEALDE